MPDALLPFQIGAFFMINLCLVVIATQFSETKKRETERMLQERQRSHSSSTLASSAEPGGCYDEIIKYIAHLMHRARRKITRYWKRRRRAGAPANGKTPQGPDFAITLHRKKRRTSPRRRKRRTGVHPPLESNPGLTSEQYQPGSVAESSPRAPRASPEISDVDPGSSPRRPNCLVVPSNGSGQPSCSESVDCSNGAVANPTSSSASLSDRNQLVLPSSAETVARRMVLNEGSNRIHLPSEAFHNSKY